MELGLWNTLWANCALGTTFFALPTIPNLNTSAPDIFSADEDSNREDHEIQTDGLNSSDSEDSQDTQETQDTQDTQDNHDNQDTQDTQDVQEEQDSETVECDAEVQNICSTDSNSFQSISESSGIQIVIVTEEKEKKTPIKKSKPFQRNKYSREEHRCKTCPYTCTTEKAFFRHLRSHTKEENEKSAGKQTQEMPRLSCPVCGKDRTGESALNNHMLRHRDQDKNFCCDICSFKTIQLKKLIQHRRMHTGERPHLCPHCVYRAARRDNLRSHVRRVHKREDLTGDTFSPRGMLLVPSTWKSATSSAATTDDEPNQDG